MGTGRGKIEKREGKVIGNQFWEGGGFSSSSIHQILPLFPDLIPLCGSMQTYASKFTSTILRRSLPLHCKGLSPVWE